MIDLILTNIIGFIVIYSMTCFYEWEIIPITHMKTWKRDGRLVFIVFVIIFSLLSLLPLSTLNESFGY